MKKFLIVIVALFPALLLSNTLEQIREKGVIRIGIDPTNPPFCSEDNGKYVGFEYELASTIAKRLFKDGQGKIEFIPIAFNKMLETVERNGVDIIFGSLAKTQEREKRVEFSIPYFSANQGILTRKDDMIQKLSQLGDRVIIVEEGTIGEDFLKRQNMPYKICSGPSKCYQNIKDKTADAYISFNLIVMAYPVFDSSVEVSINNIDKALFIAAFTQKGNKELINFVNNQIIALSKEGFFRQAFENTFEPFYKGKADKKQFLLEDLYNVFG